MDYRTETWIAVDLNFESEKSRGGGKELYLSFGAEFTNRSTGTTLTLPGFWYGGRTFTVRFAPTEPGEWTYRTICPADPSLDARCGTVTADPYSGDLAVYRHGFVTTNGSKHFVYADGTPFFYLGDTHWNMYAEEFDGPGPHAGDTGAESHFRYIVDRRAEQGFTVYQSEPIGTGTGYSFPSGHATTAGPICGGLAVSSRKRSRLVFWILIVLILRRTLSGWGGRDNGLTVRRFFRRQPGTTAYKRNEVTHS